MKLSKKLSFFTLSILLGIVQLVAQSTDFVTTWKTDNPGTSSPTSVTIPTSGSGYNYSVSWREVGNETNSGNVGPFTGSATIDFPSAGTYQLRISGDFPRIVFNNGGDKEKILSVDQWGDQVWSSMAVAFRGCVNLHVLATDAPNLSNVTSMALMFYYATSFNEPIDHWDVSNITNMDRVFGGTSLNQDLNGWNVSNVTNMYGLFVNASSFNGNISSWDVSKVTNMGNLFSGATVFNQDISGWNVNSATDMRSMFGNTSNFNQDISNWDVSGVTNMYRMFYKAAAFNQNIGGWNVSQVTDMSSMFYAASAFNQDLSSWEVSQVSNMASMFSFATTYDQSMELWDISSVTNMSNMLIRAGLSVINYQSTLQGWSIQDAGEGPVPLNLTLGATDLQYCEEGARNTLTIDYGWTITNDVLVAGCSLSVPGSPAATTTGSAVTVTWQDNTPNETGYEVERSTDNGLNYSLLTTTPANTTQYEDTTAPYGDLIYRIRAVNTLNQSDYQEVTVTLNEPEPPLEALNTQQTHEATYNGNISAMRWKGANDEEEQAYTFSYDGLNRLKKAQYAAGQSAAYTANRGYYSVPEISYDLNGNITGLTRQGANLDGAQDVIDRLTYEYGEGTARHSNELLGVADTRGGSGFVDKNKQGDDYAYDANGNMTQDLNKEITNIDYNYLNLPERVDFENGNAITYLYDAAGIKLRQRVYEDGAIAKQTDYVGGYIYETEAGEARKLQLIQHEEGRIIPVIASDSEAISYYDYQYHLKDHLGNVRVTFATTPENYSMDATMEYSEEASNFNNYQATSDAVAANSGTHVFRNSNTVNSGLGMNTFLSVNKRDTVKVSAYSYYNDAGGSYNLAAGLIEGALFGTYGGNYGVEGATVTQSNFNDAFAAGTALGGRSGSSDVPRAYINYIFFNTEMEYQRAGFKQITSSSNGTSVQVVADDFIAEQEGYLMVYLSNETQGSEVVVSWDDLNVYHGKTNVVSTQDYYPFGLTFNESKRTASTDQKFKYNSFEHMDDLNLNLYDYSARQYDPAIGRFINVDPAADLMRRHSPYNYAFDNPIRYIDPDGMMPEDRVTTSSQDNTYLKYELVDDENNIHRTTYTRRQSTTTTATDGEGNSRSTTTSSTETITSTIDGEGNIISSERTYVEQITDTKASGGFGGGGVSSNTETNVEEVDSDFDLNQNETAQQFTQNVVNQVEANPEWNPFNGSVTPESVDLIGTASAITSAATRGKIDLVTKVLGPRLGPLVYAAIGGIALGNQYRTRADHSGKSLNYKRQKDGSFKLFK